MYSIACGGDGTVVWVVEELIKAQVVFERVVCTLLTLGTGNDFAIATGFGPDPPNSFFRERLEGVKKYLRKCLLSEVKKFDVWDIEVHCYPTGRILRVEKEKGKSQFSKVSLKRENIGLDKEELKIWKRKMSNYCSIGVDARIGFGFDKKRGKSRSFNKLIYGWEGLKKFFCQKLVKMKSVINKLEQGPGIVNLASPLDKATVFHSGPLPLQKNAGDR